METLDRRALTLATAARQLLATRASLTAEAATEHLLGLQAQEPLEPYVGLWSRLEGFAAAELAGALEGRRVVRSLTMRRTVHLHTARDFLALRPAHQQMIRTRMTGTLRGYLPGVDLDELTAAGEPLFAAEPHTGTEVGRVLADRWPEAEPRWLGDALTCLLPLVQVPPRGVWGSTGPARCTTARAWLGADPAAPDDVLERLVLRYLLAFGPATSSDLRAWCGIAGLPAAVKAVRPQLVSYRDERGRELLDVAGGTVPTADAALPVRFLPAFDNAVLGYDDRSRVIDDEHRGLSVTGARFVLVDGRVAATWEPGPGARRAPGGPGVTLRVGALRALTSSEVDEVVHEGEALAAFLGDGATGRVEVAGQHGS